MLKVKLKYMILWMTTGIGAEGIHGVDGRDFLIANTADEFAEKVLSLLDNPSKQIELGKHAKDFAQSHFDNLSIGKKLIEFFNSNDKK